MILPEPITNEPPSNADFQHKFLSELLLSRAVELAAAASEALLRADPRLAQRYHPVALAKWAEHYHARIVDLSASISAGRPSLFANQVIWAKAAFAARAVPIEDLRISLTTLGAVLRFEVIPEDATVITFFIGEAIAHLDSHLVEPPSRLSTASLHGRTGANYLLAILEGDRRRAAQVVLDAVRDGVRVRDAYTEILMPVQQEIGRMWHADELNIAEEHFATTTTQSVMSRLLGMIEPEPPTGRTVVSAAVAGNTHEIGVRVVADFFEMAGWRSVYLGADVPGEDLVHACRDFNADVLALSATLPAHLRQVEHTLALLRSSLEPSPKVIVGGPAFGGCAGLWHELGADGCAASADEAVALGNLLAPPILPR